MVEVIHLTKRYRGLTLTVGGIASAAAAPVKAWWPSTENPPLFISRADAAGLYEAVTGIVLN